MFNQELWQSLISLKEKKELSLDRIVAASKKQSIDKIIEAYNIGVRDFGENYVQELSEKQQQLGRCPEIRWHFIGHLQKNKVKLVVGKVDLIQSVDSLALAQKISDVALQLSIKQKVLLEVNLGDEATKSGFAAAEFMAVLAQVMELSGLDVVGLMCLPPPEKPEFLKAMKDLFDVARVKYPNLRQLSMGTSADYSQALQVGATMIRIGTALFGERS